MTIKTIAFVRSLFLLILIAAAILVLLKPGIVSGAFLLLVAISLVFVVRWHARKTAYVCPRCEHTFSITAWMDFTSPHTGDSKWLECPSCHIASWCPAIEANVKHSDPAC